MDLCEKSNGGDSTPKRVNWLKYSRVDYKLHVKGFFLHSHQWYPKWLHCTKLRTTTRGSPFPYIFLLCTVGLISLLSSCLEYKVCRGASSSNHLLFLDSNIIFCKAEEDITKKYLTIVENIWKCLWSMYQLGKNSHGAQLQYSYFYLQHINGIVV